MEDTITISTKRYNEMQDELLFLECLRGAGVDNWEGYPDACGAYALVKEDEKEEQD